MQRLVVIDDDQAFCDTMQDVLEGEGFAVRVAIDGPTGVALVRDWRPDLVLCDLHMQGPSGFDVLQSLRHDRLTASIPLIFLTGDTADATQRRSMELGADDYLAKPFEHRMLLRAIEARLARRTQIQEGTEKRIAELRASISHSVPHEFLTPLTGVLGLSSLLVEEGAGLPSEVVHEAAVGIQEAGRQLHRLVEKFLLFTELELLVHDPVRPQRSVAADAAAEAVREAGRERARSRRRDADLDLTAVTPTAVGASRDHLVAIVSELVDNACTFSQEGTRIGLALGDSTLVVEDHGKGMTPEQIQRLGAFVQIDRRRWEQPGTGLGLAIVARVADLAGGRVSIEAAPEQGTRITVALPVADPGSAL